ncbi:hypothetical protein GCM10009530_63640 [Microbispora corallina]|uniref:Uncharacterized protein n=1 Tax=Microbispora corallina TaxID=83302 RepID=A0ABQ4GC10_9ACTN|nr:hypothetical protein [Microbispora corallina]GIH44587.1 hypothetical protein Mco01_75870 [Microbispora corallina]
MTEPTAIMAAIDEARRRVIADLFPDWPHEPGDVLHVGKQRDKDGETHLRVWMKRDDLESPAVDLGEDATQDVLAAILKYVEAS